MPFTNRPFHRILLYFLFEISLIFLIGLGLFAPFAHARGEACLIRPNPEWTSNEKQVWKTLCRGQRAILSTPSIDGSISTTAPIIRKEFLEEILLDFKYKKAIETRGVHITGAQISGPLDLSYASLSYPLDLEYCRFKEAVSLRGVRIDGYLSFYGSTFLVDLNLSSMRVDGTLVLERGTFKSVNIAHSRVQEQILMNASTFQGSVRMDSIKTGATVALRSSTIEGALDLHASDIGFDVSITNSTVGRLDLSRSRVHGSVSFGGKDIDNPNQDGKAFFEKVSLINAEIENDLSIMSSTIGEEFLLTQIRVHKLVDIKYSNLSKMPLADLTFSDIGGLVIDHVYLPSLNLSGTAMHQPMELGLITWNENATLSLRGTEIKILIDDADSSWPNTIDLRGFVYSKAFSVSPGTKTLTARSSDWLKRWLSKQELYAPQPYVQLASVLRSEGHKDKAEEILFESKELERSLTKDIPTWIWLTAQKYLIGYGYRTIYYPILWAFGFALIGCLMLLRFQNPFNNANSSPATSFLPLPIENWLPYGLAALVNQFFATLVYSLDRFLPAVKLRERIHPTILPSGWLSYWFHFQQLMGYVVAAFFIAGLSGLIEK